MSHVTLVLGVNENLKSALRSSAKEDKLPPGQDKRTKNKKPQATDKPVTESKQNPGFWRRNFGRKSGDK